MKQNLYIADAESSSIRTISLNKGHVKCVAGGDLEPDNLFAFGDCDGVGNSAKLQHPLGVFYLNSSDALIIVDTYNSCLKRIDLKTKNCQKLKNETNIELNEPSGVFVDDSFNIWIADSNNHSIKYVKNYDPNSLEYKLEEFKIEFNSNRSLDDVDFSKLNLNNITGIQVLVKFNVELNENADNSWKITIFNRANGKIEQNGKLAKHKDNTFMLKNLKLDIGSIERITLAFHLITCVEESNGKVCKMVNVTKDYDAADIKGLVNKFNGQSDFIFIYI